jgi:protein-disulfide isomerase
MREPVTQRPLLLGGLLLLAALLGAGLFMAAQALFPALPGGDRARTEQVVHDYVLAHPEIIPEAIDRLHDKQNAQLIAANRSEIVTPYAGAFAGNPQGDVTLVEYLDYACGYCRASLPTLARLIEQDPKVKIVYRELPVLSDGSRVAARWALAAAEQGKYKAFHDALYALDGPTDANIQSAARTAGLDLAKAQAAAASPRVEAEINKNLAMGNRLGMSGTPSWVVGDKLLVGAQSFDALVGDIAAARAG